MKKTPVQIKALIALSILAGEEKISIPYFNRGLPIWLPAGQNTGTVTQQTTYAQLKANQIFEDHNDY